MWCYLEMVGPESQSSSAGAAIKGPTEWRKLCLDLSLSLAGSCSQRGCRGSFSCLCFSRWDETARVICMGGGQFPQQVQAIVRIVLHHGIRSPVCVRQLLQDAVPGSSFATYMVLAIWSLYAWERSR